jgi:hypothetical protein
VRHLLKIEQLIETANRLGFTKPDFADLAICASKQSGATEAEQAEVAATLGIEIEARDQGTKSALIGRLGVLCKRLGGQLALVSGQEIRAMIHRDYPDYDNYGTPEEAEAAIGFDLADGERFTTPDNTDNHGQEWGRKIIYAVEGHESVGHIIHEMGHVFADRYPPNNSKCREWRWFGWEIEVARQIGAWKTWSDHQADRFVSNGTVQWSTLTAKRRHAVIAERIRYAKKIGILGEAGEPRSIR